MNDSPGLHGARDKAGACKAALLLIVSLALAAAVSQRSSAQESFDHFSTGFELDGAHANVGCDRCHAGASFEGTNPICVSCHSQIGSVLASMKPANHIASNEICADCHTTAAWSPVAFMDHAAGTGTCGYCHNGFSATGKTPDHIPSTAQCDDCHQTNFWVPAVFDHANIVGNSGMFLRVV